MPSRASVVNLNWGYGASTYGQPSARFAASTGSNREAQGERQSTDSDGLVTQLDEESFEVESSSSTIEAYNEVAFRYFLGVEEKRFIRSNHRFLLFLLELNDSESGAFFEPALSKKVFAALSPCVRETDFMGWYRQAQVIGVVCTQLDDRQGTDVSGVVVGRFQSAIRDVFPIEIADRMNMRSYFLPSNGANRS
jgi:hypothetical protein